MSKIDYEKMEHYALENHVPIMQAEGISFLVDIIQNNNIKSILEIGSAIGYSALKMSDVNESVHIVTLERDEERYLQACNNIKAAKKEKQIDILHTDALQYDTTQKFDLIFIDAAKAQYIKFFNQYANNLKKDGMIISDNLKFHGLVDESVKIKNRNTRQLVRKIREYVVFLEQHPNFSSEFLDIGDGIAITKWKK